MNTEETIVHKVEEGLQPAFLEVTNESNKHNVPANSETHFKVLVVSQQFEGQSLINRHRIINKLLKDELSGGVHALALHTMTPPEWDSRQKQGGVADSPDCQGGDGRAGKPAG